MSIAPTVPATRSPVVVRRLRHADFGGVRDLCALVYPSSPSWGEEQLSSHLRVFPEGQFVAVSGETGELIGLASSLIIRWEDYGLTANWWEITDQGMFNNHDPRHGRTLYGAEVMVHPGWRRQGVGKQLYAARRDLVADFGLLRIRAGARLRDYHRHAERLSPERYVAAVIRGDLEDRTLTFQLSQGFLVIGVVARYLAFDPESLGHAAVIEWVNEAEAARVGYEPPTWAGPA